LKTSRYVAMVYGTIIMVNYITDPRGKGLNVNCKALVISSN